ncbi:MAG: hypothetical protein UR99_C0032G0014 [Candidatus Moranbacteria bacterium GW2011_GWD2_36_12]|nr:MAG: hypothetical protein UR99_C0032G0014 [Candidatus Moranbacteria bacterium GW2011_GWD2_36_12]KKQ06642.1 MAG: hypothetical protein US16_C0012G0002 [Candidatus Moranbacteria bacterium GW2011_GWE2_36_40]
MKVFQIVIVALVGVSLFIASPCHADDLENIRLRLQNEANISEPQLVELIANESILELEGLMEPAIGSAEEVIQLLMAFGIIERQQFWLEYKLNQQSCKDFSGNIRLQEGMQSENFSIKNLRQEPIAGK